MQPLISYSHFDIFSQVGVIILYDHVHPLGAFVKTSNIDVSKNTKGKWQ